MKGMLLAAGGGTRLRPLTLNCPKPMLPVSGRPMLEYTIAWLKYYGVTDIGINLHHCPNVITDYFGDGSAFGVHINYSLEESAVGTAGGVKRMSGYFDSTFILVFGDVLTDFGLRSMVDFHRTRTEEPHLSMSLHRVRNPWECGIVKLDAKDRVTAFVEKPSIDEVFSDLANAGVLIMDPELLEFVPEDGFFDLGLDLIPKLLQSGVPMYGWTLPNMAYLIDIGSPEAYQEVQRSWPTRSALRYLVKTCDT